MRAEKQIGFQVRPGATSGSLSCAQPLCRTLCKHQMVIDFRFLIVTQCKMFLQKLHRYKTHG